jgi:hypothetical protein
VEEASKFEASSTRHIVRDGVEHAFGFHEAGWNLLESLFGRVWILLYWDLLEP